MEGVKTALLYALLVAGQTADTGTTCWALHNGFSEANVLLPKTCRGIVGFKIGATAGAITLSEMLRRNHQPKWARRVRIAFTISGWAATGYNVSVIISSR